MGRINKVPTFAEFVACDWRTSCYQRCKPSTRKRMDSALATQLLPTFGALPLNRVGESDVHRWFDHYSRTAPAGANRTLDILRQLFNFAVTCGHLKSNPASSVKRNRRPQLTRFLTKEEIGRLHAALDVHRGRKSGAQQAEIIRLLLLTGCRKSEILKLRWTEIDGDRLCLLDSKTGPRTVLLNLQAKKILARQPKKLGSKYVFPDPRNIGRHRSDELSLWRKIRCQAGIADVRLHDLRHTFASHAVMQQIPLPIVSRLLGHRKAEMTFRYAHVSDNETQMAAERIGIALTAALNGDTRDYKLPAAPVRKGEVNQLTELPQESPHCPFFNAMRDKRCSEKEQRRTGLESAALGSVSAAELLREHLDDDGWTVTEAARRLGFTRQTLSRVLNRRMGISAAMALAFERIGWRNAAFWVCMQALNELECR